MTATRYGIFLRPDPVTCCMQAQLNTVIVQQFGLLSAAAFPPHATLVGNLCTKATVAELIERLDRVSPPPARSPSTTRSGPER